MTTRALAERLGARLIGSGSVVLTHPDTLERAGAGAITFIRSAEYASMWAASRAGAALVSEGIEVPGHEPSARALLFVADADLALNTVLELFAPPRVVRAAGVHPSAVVEAGAFVHPAASVGPLCVIEAGARVGQGAVLFGGCHVGSGASIGASSMLHPGVVVGVGCIIGRGSILHSGVVLGADGFGYRPDPTGGLRKIPHIGIVEVGNGVEIGANTCIDRAKFGATVIGDGTKIDNLVQIAHNCRVGRSCIICGCTALAGSVSLGDGVILGGDVAISDNCHVGDRAKIAANARLMHNVPAGETWIGTPARPYRVGVRNLKALERLGESMALLRELARAAGKTISGNGPDKPA